MRESQRLAYLQAIGVTGWVPRLPLVHAAKRLPAQAESFVECAEAAPASPVPAEPITPAAVSPSARLVEQRRAQIAAQPAKQRAPDSGSTVELIAAAPTPAVELAGLSVAPFYLQLWLAGPCALLIEIADPGLEKGTSEHNLLCDILRAAGLPATPRLLADFRWPLSRNPQVARSAEAASEALQVFMQARLEQKPVSSIGCFGAMAGLLATPDPESATALKGREQALEELGPGWFAPGIETMLRQPEEKARLWQLLKRVMPRWKDAI